MNRLYRRHRTRRTPVPPSPDGSAPIGPAAPDPVSGQVDTDDRNRVVETLVEARPKPPAPPKPAPD